MKRFVRLFESSSVRFLAADREFIGKEWLAYLHQQQVPYRLRIRTSDLVTLPDGSLAESASLLRRKTRCRKRALGLWGVPVFLGGKPLKGGDCLVLVSNEVSDLLADYRLRWSIETLFQSLKGRGFDLEATHVTAPSRLCRLLGLLAFAFVWSFKTGEWLHQRRPTPMKKHGRSARSLFQRGLKFLRRLLLPLSGRFHPDDFVCALARLTSTA